ncbi:MAG TPA: Ppx/GppA phosphatase family protein [Syntrophorhabdaceae bacterium]|nr:Ppx/GppA phosphatase family protein [Syntrophorhabdaceae bacterium]HOL06466.1 Ppx/GppA phosphatase family protein [Syntrophorhabdaceae bacterium]HON85876.1 Ppx/GppA phosphatase family protein [Syntrophorhabdaceae bacterium]HOT41791.1 Ppx/GppA phosphatase family protein [Syntrophorhabdaceae bacterium]HPC67281.1 Ppx/GppA phosphatase family protein [Syntrophorhabdaceae bacterium]
MKYASIDIGTNTVLLLIAESKKSSGINDILDISTITRLGQGLKKTGHLSQEAMDRTLSALKAYIDIIHEQGVGQVFCVGTSALREAENSTEFLKKIHDSLGLDVRVISERDEAYYTYLSVIRDNSIHVDRCIITDIGGGSTEVIKGDKERFIDFVSLPVGSVKLTDMFIKNDPPLEKEMEKTIEYIKAILKIPFDGHGCSFIGTGGTITNIAAIMAGMEKYKKERIHGARITIKDMEGLIKRFVGLKISQRSNIAGLEKGREDTILQGMVLLYEIMSYFDFKDVMVSAHGVRYGVLMGHDLC